MRQVATALAVLFVPALLPGMAICAEGSKPSEELLVLEDLIGTWDEVMTNKPTQWAPKAEKSTSITKRTWALGGKFIRAEGTWQPAKTEFLHLMTFDSEAKTYRSWYYDAHGSIPRGSTKGDWDADSRTMKWSSTDEHGNQVTSTHRIVDKDHFEWTMVIKKPDGVILLDFAGKCTRRKERSAR